MGEYPLFNLLYPGAEYPNWHLVFAFTGCRAGVAADALAVVNYKAVFQCWSN